MLTDKPIDLLPAPAKGTIGIVPMTSLPKDDAVVRSRVQKADYALGKDSPGQDAIAADFWTGFEQRVREQAAIAESIDRREHYQQTSLDIINAAALQGRPLNDLETEYVLDRPDYASDKTALEQRWARRTMDETFDDELSKGMHPTVIEPAKKLLTYQQLAQKHLDAIKAKYDETSWASWGIDFAKQIVPFYTWSNVHNRMEGVGASSFFTGSNIAEQMRGLYFSSTPEEFDEKLGKAIDEIAQSNIIDAVQFAQAAVGYSTSDAVLDNVFAGMDAVDVATLGTSTALGLLAKTGGKVGRAARVAKKATDVIRYGADPNMSNIDRRVLAGDAEGAAIDGVKDKLSEVKVVDAPGADVKVGETIGGSANNPSKDGFGLADPENYLRNAGSLTNENQRRLMEQLEQNSNILKSSGTDLQHIVRTDEATFLKGVELAKKEFLRVNYRLEDSIVDVRPVREQLDVFGGIDRVEFLIGDKNALPFKSPQNAEFYAKNVYKLPDGGYDIEQVGGSFVVRAEKSVREDSLEMLDMRLNTENTTPANWTNTYLKWLANPDDVRSEMSRMSAKQATYGAQAVLQKMSEVTKSIGTLGKNERDRLRTIMDEARFKTRKVLDPNGQQVSVSGVFYHTVGDLEQAYMKRGFGLPSQKEVAAYFSFRQVMDYDHYIRNISMRRDMARLGVNQKSVGWIYTDEAGKKTYKQSDFFNGRIVDALPSDARESYTIGWYNGKSGKTRFVVSDAFRGQGRKGLRDELDDLLSQDYKIVQVFDPTDEGVQSFVRSGGEPVQYLVVRDLKEKPLASLQVPYNEGGHWIYPQMGAYLKQPSIRKTAFQRRIYNGDVTAHWFFSTKEGAKYRDAYETARDMMNRNDPNLGAFVSANLPYDEAKFRSLFKTKTNPEGAFDPNLPFLLTESGQSTGDVTDLRKFFSEPLVNLGQSEHSLSGRVSSQFSQERGERLMSVKSVGTQANPVFKLQPAPLMDSFDALGRSMAALAKSRFFDDYKHQTLENFITQFQDVMGKSKEEFLADPMSFIRNPVWRETGDRQMIAAAKQNRRALLYLLNQDTTDMGVIKWARQKIVDGVLGIKDTKILDPWMWSKTADPGMIGRSAVFHMKLGLLNVVQYPLQAQAVLHAAAIDGSPIRAAQANFLYWSMRMRGLAGQNSKAQSMFGRAMSRALGVDQRTVDEMYDAFQKSGMANIEGAYARLDDYLNPKEAIGRGGLKKGLDAAAFFFNEGNRTHRGVSFATSFLRWRSENPLKALNAEEMRKIIDRADLYYVNMSRASNNDILAGSVLSVPAQFFTFHANVMQQLLGKRLTAAEKARVIGMYSTVYGVPIGAGIGIPGAAVLWPVSDSIRQKIEEEGLDYDSNMVTKFLVDGAGSMAIEQLTGEKYNFGERYGPGGMTWVRDLLDGNLFDVVSGASGSSLGDAMARAEPFMSYVVSVFTPGAETFPLTKDDFIDASKEISSISNVSRAWAAVNTGMFLTKSDSPIVKMDADAMDGIAIALGLSPQVVSDTYLRIRSMKQDREAKAELGKEVKKWFARGMKASVEGNQKDAEQFYKRAHVLLEMSNLTPLERGELWKEAVSDNRPLFDKIDRNFMKADPEKRMQRYLNEGNQ